MSLRLIMKGTSRNTDMPDPILQQAFDEVKHRVTKKGSSETFSFETAQVARLENFCDQIKRKGL